MEPKCGTHSVKRKQVRESGSEKQAKQKKRVHKQTITDRPKAWCTDLERKAAPKIATLDFFSTAVVAKDKEIHI